jgi:hypothetical protein
MKYSFVDFIGIRNVCSYSDVSYMEYLELGEGKRKFDTVAYRAVAGQHDTSHGHPKVTGRGIIKQKATARGKRCVLSLKRSEPFCKRFRRDKKRLPQTLRRSKWVWLNFAEKYMPVLTDWMLDKDIDTLAHKTDDAKV